MQYVILVPRHSLPQPLLTFERDCVQEGFRDPQHANELHIFLCRRVQPRLCKGLPSLPRFCPRLQEGCPPCGALDEPFVGCLSMHVIAHRAVCPALVPWRGTTLPSDIAPEPVEPQHAPGAPHGEPGGPVAPSPRAVPPEGVGQGWIHFKEVHHYGGMLSAARPADTASATKWP